MSLPIPDRLRSTAARHPAGTAWLARLPGRVAELVAEWDLSVRAFSPFADATASLVLPVLTAEGTPAVLKVALPHMEARDEVAGLRFWDGDPTVRVLRAAERIPAMLLERCEPGTPLASEPPARQDAVLAELLPRLWRAPEARHPFRALGFLVEQWRREAARGHSSWRTARLLDRAWRTFRELDRSSGPEVVLATDAHAGNVLRAARRRWVMIDPKPFVGDRTFDLLQHLLNHPDRLAEDLTGVTDRFAIAAGIDPDRLRRWLFVRVVIGPLPSRHRAWPDIAAVLRDTDSS